ncbi:MAG: glucose-6-phosphate dehydrogenase, partial [Chloroflexota bacterium]|nr:glucose-6-phosphate dehydrogenase [Chloroflexota bacterium]
MVTPEVKVPEQPAEGDGTRPVPVTAPPPRPNPLREGLRLERMAEPCTMIICGATGDLTERKLGPALYNTLLGGFLPPEFTVVGFARRDLSDEDFRNHLLEGINKHSRNKPAKPAIWESFARGIEYHRGDFDDPAAYVELAKRLERIDRDRGTAGNRLFYLAVPPSLYPEIVNQLD